MGPNGVIGQVVRRRPALVDGAPFEPTRVRVRRRLFNRAVRKAWSEARPDGLLYLENIDSDVQVSVGDVVLAASGLGGSYTRGLLIGTVVKIEGAQNDASRRIVVLPNDAATSLEEVLVVTSASESSSDSSSSQSKSSSSTGGAQ